jgi:hypothetical protein
VKSAVNHSVNWRMMALQCWLVTIARGDLGYGAAIGCLQRDYISITSSCCMPVPCENGIRFSEGSRAGHSSGLGRRMVFQAGSACAQPHPQCITTTGLKRS